MKLLHMLQSKFKRNKEIVLSADKLDKNGILNMMINEPSKLRNLYVSDKRGILADEVEINDILYILNSGIISEINLEFENTSESLELLKTWIGESKSEIIKFSTELARVTIINGEVTSISYKMR